MTITDFIRNPLPALDLADNGESVFITRRGKIYRLVLETK